MESNPFALLLERFLDQISILFNNDENVTYCTLGNILSITVERLM